MVMKMCGLCFKQALITTFRIFNIALVCFNVQLIPKFNSPISFFYYFLDFTAITTTCNVRDFYFL